ncbi:hypothetical protein H4582DRAFT_1926043 [Lactarius indigo]|nr:hypothetical protein H4582DRAFT_1926043 [Lactarius indigo]
MWSSTLFRIATRIHPVRNGNKWHGTEACKRTPPLGINLQSPKGLRTVSYQTSDVTRQARQELTEPLSHYYQHVAIAPPPPDPSKNRPLRSAAVDLVCDSNYKKTKTPNFSRRTTSTALYCNWQQIAPSQAPITYLLRFFHADPPEDISCPCDSPPPTQIPHPSLPAVPLLPP